MLASVPFYQDFADFLLHISFGLPRPLLTAFELTISSFQPDAANILDLLMLKRPKASKLFLRVFTIFQT